VVTRIGGGEEEGRRGGGKRRSKDGEGEEGWRKGRVKAMERRLAAA